MNKQSVHINYDKLIVDIHHLSKSFGSNTVLRDIDLQVHEGENLVVLGRSGTGKSVLIKIIAGLLKPDAGSVEVLGQNVAELDRRALEQLRLQLGFSFQNSALYDSMTVWENLAFPLQQSGKKVDQQSLQQSIEETLEAVGLLQAMHQLPAELSGGQRKRIGIARTLIMRPALMLYDEPTAGLDPITSGEINELINEVQERYHTSAIIITHDLTCAKATGDKLAVLLDGRFVHEGTFDQVFAHHDERIRQFYDYNFITA